MDAALAPSGERSKTLMKGASTRIHAPSIFWLSIVGMILLGLFILGVGWRSLLVGAEFQLTVFAGKRRAQRDSCLLCSRVSSV